MAGAAGAEGRLLQADPSNYASLVRQLEPGDRLVLAPGRYTRGLLLHGLVGRPDAPIVIEGAPEGQTVFEAHDGENTARIANAAYLTLRQLAFDGRHVDGDAVKCEGGRNGPSHHITLERLLIRDHDGDQSTVGISTKCTAWNWVIRNNTIERAGTGIYLGDSDGTAPFVAGAIVGNRVSGTRGYNMEIKHQVPRAYAQGMPVTPQTTTIARNVFRKLGNSSTGVLARPNVLVGTFPAVGPGSEDRYVVEGNLFDGNPTEALFQAEGNVVFRNNRAFNEQGDGIVFQPHHGTVKRAVIEGNTVAAFGYAVQIPPDVDATRITFRSNVVLGVVSFAGLDDSVNAVRPYDAEEVARLRGARRLTRSPRD